MYDSRARVGDAKVVEWARADLVLGVRPKGEVPFFSFSCFTIIGFGLVVFYFYLNFISSPYYPVIIYPNA